MRRTAAPVRERPVHMRVVREVDPARADRGSDQRAGTNGRPRPTAPKNATPRVVVLLVCATAALALIGLVMVLSASSVSSFRQFGSSFLFFRRQAAYAVVGAGALFLTSRVRYAAWQRLAVPLLAVTVVLLLMVLRAGAGAVAGGSARWLSFGPVTVQPSELAKLAVVVFGATVLVRKRNRLDRLGHFLIPLAPVAVLICALIYVQPDLGTTVIVAGTIMLLSFSAGVRIRYLIGGGMVMGFAALALIKHYQRLRLLSFLHPWRDPLNTGYQTIQSLIALGSGGWLGVGLGASRQKWMYVPNAHTDFIFAILGEELGLVGELVVLLLFGTLIWCGARIAARARDSFGRLLASGIVGWLALQTLVNLGAVTGVLPVTGVPLPLVSFGGSSLVVTLAAVGILVNIGRSSERVARNGKANAGRPKAAKAGTR